MTLTLDLPPALEARLEAEAAKRNEPVETFAVAWLEETLPEKPRSQTGAELVARLEEEGILGMWADRADIGDSLEYARKLRSQAETRGRD